MKQSSAGFLAGLLLLSGGTARAQAPTEWLRSDTMIPMRDGVRLKTYLVRPVRAAGALPILLMRTPYGAGGSAQNFPGAYGFLASDGYIFAFQDIRGRGESQGRYLMNRPLRTDSAGVDEAVDSYDTIDWLIQHVPGNNGRVGGLGISYPGWLATMQALSGHPALRAVSPQAPMSDTWMGDDFFHQGAFRMSYGVEYTYGMEVGDFDVGSNDMYDWYLRLGPLSNVVKRLGTSWPSWDGFLAHPRYDAYWQSRATPNQVRRTPLAVLNVGGWYDQEDILGASNTYRAFERTDTRGLNRIVLGPWNHGGWYGPGTSLGQVQFGDSTGVWFRREVEAPFFAYYLHDTGPLRVAEATVFEGGANQWRWFAAWPPKAMTPRNLYLRADGKLSFDPPPAAAQAFDSFVSDPAHPVPYRPRPVQVTYSSGSEWRIWQAVDQRFVDGRPDVLRWETEPLTSEVVIAGDLEARLFAATTGSDADWVVKLIDVYPDTVSGNRAMGGYQLMIAGEIMRGRYRRSFERPAPIPPGQVLEYTVKLPPQAYRFQRGHRIMVQVQSTWFPLYDRNPQTWVPSIFDAKASDYRARTHRIWRTAARPSHLILPVLPQ
jgi:putative CocE/NonD family hydrolase